MSTNEALLSQDKLRKHIRVLIAQASLVSKDKKIRINAAKTIFQSKSLELLPLINIALENEQNKLEARRIENETGVR